MGNMGQADGRFGTGKTRGRGQRGPRGQVGWEVWDRGMGDMG